MTDQPAATRIDTPEFWEALQRTSVRPPDLAVLDHVLAVLRVMSTDDLNELAAVLEQRQAERTTGH
ncbi:MAG TPA: hypothetical protein VGW38_10500 [Chloroflexota bacterium]|nr:hypothetical protein [Chloroflexota bacterium]